MNIDYKFDKIRKNLDIGFRIFLRLSSGQAVKRISMENQEEKKNFYKKRIYKWI